MAGAIGGLFGGGGVLGGLFGGGGIFGGMLNSLTSSFGLDNIIGAVSNLLLDSIGTAIKGFIDSTPFLPDFMKDAAKGLVDKIIDGAKQEVSPEAEEAVRNSPAADPIKQAGNDIATSLVGEADEEASKGGNWLIVLAKAMANVQADHLEKAMENQADMASTAGTEDPRAFQEASAEFQANMKLFGMSAEATSTSLKTLGEALASLARKQ